MKKLYILTAIMASQCFASTNCAEKKDRMATYRILYKLVQEGPINWEAVFAALDNSTEPVNVNHFVIPYSKSTLLEEAVQRRNFFAIKTLLEKYNADPNAISNDQGLTAMVLACLGENYETIKLMLMHGGNPYSIHKRTGRNCFELIDHNPKLVRLLNPYKNIKQI